MDPLAKFIDHGQFLEELRAGIFLGEADGADLENGVIEGVIHHERQGQHVVDGAEGAPNREPVGVPGAIGRGCEVEAGLVAPLEDLEWNRCPKPHVLSEGLESDAADAGLILDDQVKALGRRGSNLHDEVFESGPIRRKVGTEVFEEELVDGLSTLEGDPFGLRAGRRSKHQHG